MPGVVESLLAASSVVLLEETISLVDDDKSGELASTVPVEDSKLLALLLLDSASLVEASELSVDSKSVVEVCAISSVDKVVISSLVFVVESLVWNSVDSWSV